MVGPRRSHGSRRTSRRSGGSGMHVQSRRANTQLNKELKQHPDASGEKWIQGAVNPAHKGKLREYVQKKYGKEGFTERGTIKESVLYELSHSENEHVRHEAQFALNVKE